MSKIKYRTNRVLWVAVSVAIFCLFLAFDPGIGLKVRPIRVDIFADPIGQTVKAILLFAIPSAALAWPLQGLAVVAWSKLSIITADSK